jgi:hypothetical protein
MSTSRTWTSSMALRKVAPQLGELLVPQSAHRAPGNAVGMAFRLVR